MRYISLSLALLFVVVGYGLQTETTSTPTPLQPPIQSLFVEDTCAPPCWFGITPGESTIDDLQKLFQDRIALFDHTCSSCEDPLTELEKDQPFNFKWKIFDRKDYVEVAGNPSNVQNDSLVMIGATGIIDYIDIKANRRVLLSEVLLKFGKPDLVFLESGGGVDDFNSARFLLLTYLPIRLQVYLWTFPTTVCKAATVQQDFNVNFLIYYSIEEAVQLFPKNDNGREIEQFPKLLVPFGRQIRNEQWEAFIKGEGYEQCEDFYNSLPTDYVLPTLPWPSPTVSPVPSATP